MICLKMSLKVNVNESKKIRVTMITNVNEEV